MALTYIGSRGASFAATSGSWSITVALPDGTTVGAGLILAASQQGGGTIAISDSRFTLVTTSPLNGTIWRGRADTLTDITVNYSGFSPTGFHAADVGVAAWVNQPNRRNSPAVDFAAGATVTVPALSKNGAGDGAVAVLVGQPDGAGTVWDGAVGYTSLWGGAGGYTQALIAHTTTQNPGPAATTWAGGTKTYSAGMTAVVIGLGPVASIAPPCRNIKRGDALDLGGARNYPPSKMRQTSSRGVGAY